MQWEDKIINRINQGNKERWAQIGKSVLILLSVTFFVLPTILCVIFLAKIHKLEKQVIKLETIEKSKNDDFKEESSNASIVYAAEKSSEVDDLTINITNKGNKPLNDKDVEQLNIQKTDLSKGNYTDRAHQVISDKDIVDKNTTDKNIKYRNTTDKNTKHKNTTGKIDKDTTNQNIKEKVPNKQDTHKKDRVTKKVYLTFDDGPSINTEKVLDVLAANKVKATFFVIGKTDEHSKKMYKRIVDEGHTLGMHSYSHKYDVIYNSVKDFDEDFNKIRNLIFEETGYYPTIYRFPGGSSNLVSKIKMSKFIKYLNKKGVVYFDWNTSNGDATNIPYTKKELVENVMSGVDLFDSAVVLMHDTVAKETTLNSLSKLIKELKDKDVEILPIDDTVKPVQHIKYDSIK